MQKKLFAKVNLTNSLPSISCVFSKKSNIGTNINPPPIPIKPESMPPITPRKTSKIIVDVSKLYYLGPLSMLKYFSLLENNFNDSWISGSSSNVVSIKAVSK